MFLKERRNDELVEVLDNTALFDPFRDRIPGRYNAGEELPEPRSFLKRDLVFCSGESLPRCWTDPDYRGQGLPRTGTHG
ncbi:MAG: acetyltransferase [Gammaproteobacteria bacterium]|nr:acetyltransferase [Gammaproteobacteria bacterium]MCP5298717.1 acetyltransferase [Chromatiaceae bacterium]